MKFATEQAVAAMLSCQEDFRDGLKLVVEVWSPTRVVKPIEINHKFIQLAMPGLPWVCFELVLHMINTVGWYVSGPLTCDELFAPKSRHLETKCGAWRTYRKGSMS